MEMLGKLLGDLAQGLLSIGGSLFISYVLYKGGALVSSYVSKIKDENLRKVFNNALERVGVMVYNGVKATEVSVGAKMKEMLADGKIDKDEILALKDVVRTEVLDTMSEQLKKDVSLGISDLDTYINQLIEIKLDEIKKEILG